MLELIPAVMTRVNIHSHTMEAGNLQVMLVDLDALRSSFAVVRWGYRSAFSVL